MKIRKIKYVGEHRRMFTLGNIYAVTTVFHIDGKLVGYLCYCDVPGLALVAAEEAIIIKEEESK